MEETLEAEAAANLQLLNIFQETSWQISPTKCAQIVHVQARCWHMVRSRWHEDQREGTKAVQGLELACCESSGGSHCSSMSKPALRSLAQSSARCRNFSISI